MSAEERLASLGIELPDAPVPAASYVPCVRTGNLLFLSGQGTMYQGERRYLGKLGKESFGGMKDIRRRGSVV
mgnify:CR=1 FL=1